MKPALYHCRKQRIRARPKKKARPPGPTGARYIRSIRQMLIHHSIEHFKIMDFSFVYLAGQLPDSMSWSQAVTLPPL